ncbi:MAG: hypothetical protein Q4C45_09815 [Oscillospiraceae bacterium]|nr:hypothetical protein [Oscillospiraceae bacterium]
MSGERLFRILGLVDDDLIVEAGASAPVRRRTPRRRVLAAAACLAVACGAGFALRAGLGPMGGASGDGAASGSGADSGIMAGSPSGDPGDAATDNEPLSAAGTAFMSYAGPVFPLTTAEPDTGLTAERKTTWDFTAGTYQDGSPRQWGAAVTDGYTLTNPTDEDITVTALYPFAGSFSELAEQPTVTVDGQEPETTLYAGAYAGGFQGVWQSDGGNGYQLDDTTLNLAQPNSWTDYKTLLESGAYLAQALGETPPLDIPVTVYEFSGFQAPHEQYRAATQAIEFTIDQTATTVLTYGFNGGSWDEETGWRQYCYFVPDGIHSLSEKKLLAVLGEDIGHYTLQGYQDGGCRAGDEIDGVSCTVTRAETTLDAVLDELCRDYLDAASGAGRQPGMEEAEVETVPYPLFRRAAAELLVQCGVLAGGGMKDRYSDGRLDDIVCETLIQERVLYLAAAVTVPAGESVDITFGFWKEPSFDYGCSDSENKDLQGYDLVTALGSTLEFTAQTAALANTDGIELVRQNLGFDLENGVTETALDPEQEHYYLEIRPLP